MTKTKLHQEVMALLSQHEKGFKSAKAFNEFKSSIEELVKPKSGGGVVQFPPIEANGYVYHFCRYTSYYIPEEHMVMSKGKSKGYSKKAIAKWTKLGNEAKLLEQKAMKLLLDKKFEEGTRVNEEMEKLKEDRNKTSMYDDVREEYEDIRLPQELVDSKD